MASFRLMMIMIQFAAGVKIHGTASSHYMEATRVAAAPIAAQSEVAKLRNQAVK